MKLKLEAARINAGLTVTDVSNSLKVHKTTIRNWERGKSIPRVDYLVSMCELYRVPINVIFLPSKSS